VDVFNGGVHGNTAFVLNRFDDFDASVAGVIVDNGRKRHSCGWLLNLRRIELLASKFLPVSS
jgi:hypothetical protein